MSLKKPVPSLQIRCSFVLPSLWLRFPFAFPSLFLRRIDEETGFLPCLNYGVATKCGRTIQNTLFVLDKILFDAIFEGLRTIFFNVTDAEWIPALGVRSDEHGEV